MLYRMDVGFPSDSSSVLLLNISGCQGVVAPRHNKPNGSWRFRLTNFLQLSFGCALHQTFNRKLKILKWKMMAFQAYRALVDGIGLGALYRRDYWLALHAMFISFAFGCTYVFSILALILSTNTDELGQPFIMMNGHTLMLSIYWIFIFNNDRPMSLLVDFQSIVDDSECAVAFHVTVASRHKFLCMYRSRDACESWSRCLYNCRGKS